MISFEILTCQNYGMECDECMRSINIKDLYVKDDPNVLCLGCAHLQCLQCIREDNERIEAMRKAILHIRFADMRERMSNIFSNGLRAFNGLKLEGDKK